MMRSAIEGPGTARALLDRPFHEWSRSDILLAKAAIRGGWPLPEADRAAIVKTLGLIAAHPERCGARKAAGAAKVLGEADRIDPEGEARRERA